MDLVQEDTLETEDDVFEFKADVSQTLASMVSNVDQWKFIHTFHVALVLLHTMEMEPIVQLMSATSQILAVGHQK